MPNPSTQSPESFSPTEAHVSGADHHLAKIAADVYTSKDNAYEAVFPATASSDKLKTDAQLNEELFNAPSPYGDTTAKVNPPDRNDNVITSKDDTAWDPYENLTLNLKSPSKDNTAWDPYENLTLNLKSPSGVVNPPERN